MDESCQYQASICPPTHKEEGISYLCLNKKAGAQLVGDELLFHCLHQLVLYARVSFYREMLATSSLWRKQHIQPEMLTQ